MFSASLNASHRPDELCALAELIADSPNGRLFIKYDAEAISARLRETSKKLWPRRRYAVTGYCYRELLSSTAKEAGAHSSELAAAMGHRSAESQGAYARASRVKKGGKKPWSSATAMLPIKMDRAPMARFKEASRLKKLKLRRSL